MSKYFLELVHVKPNEWAHERCFKIHVLPEKRAVSWSGFSVGLNTFTLSSLNRPSKRIWIIQWRLEHQTSTEQDPDQFTLFIFTYNQCLKWKRITAGGLLPLMFAYLPCCHTSKSYEAGKHNSCDILGFLETFLA